VHHDPAGLLAVIWPIARGAGPEGMRAHGRERGIRLGLRHDADDLASLAR